MNSLRRRLLLRLLLGLGALWLVAVVFIYGIVRKSLFDQIDAELQLIAVDVPLLLPEGGAIPQASASERMLEFFILKSGFYFEVWDDDLLFSDPSPSLGKQALPFPETFSETPVFSDFTLDDGETLRVITVRQASRIMGSPDSMMHNVVAGINRTRLDRPLEILVAGSLVAGLAIALLAALVVRFSVITALRPLQQVKDQLADMHAGSLRERFNPGELPDEIQPVVEHLNDLMARLESSFERERRFSADLAHELRTPVAELKALTEVALKWPEQAGPDQHREVLAISEEMQTIIETLLSLSRLEQGILPDPEPVNLATLVQRIWRPFAEQAVARELTVNLKVPEELELAVQADLLARILSNLLGNAAAYTPTGGSVDLEIAEEHGQLSLRLSNDVEGLSADQVERLFDRFWRGDASRTGGGHSGLGLTLARSCAEAIGLHLEANLAEDGKKIHFLMRRPPAS
ncbi:MAG: signal transduction histidine kinase [Verrucomicrobiales bacterium]|jgi:signal transduction histidine kinase